MTKIQKALEMNDPENPWMDIKEAPFMEVIEVANNQMDNPVRATRGYVYNDMVHSDLNIFTSVYTPHRFFPMPAGRMVCPTKWRRITSEPQPLRRAGANNENEVR